MKRTFDQITPSEEPVLNLMGQQYNVAQKRQKIEGQRIGDFIVKAIESVHFKIVKSENDINDVSGSFFAPKYLYWMLGEEERIMGYEGL